MNLHNNEVAWIAGEWVSSSDFKIPICDRGLKLSDGIFETILILKGSLILFSKHIDRLNNSAKILGLPSPPGKIFIHNLVMEGIKNLGIENKNGILRLNWSRGNSTSRNIYSLEAEENLPRFWMEIRSGDPSFDPISTLISKYEKRNLYSRLNQCKTFAYNQSIQAKREAKLSGFDDALLENTNHEICCGTTANLIVKRGDQFLTPPLSSGCLPGVMRQKGIDLKIIRESKLTSYPEKNDQWILLNSLSCRPIRQVNNCYLEVYKETKKFWLDLINH